MSDLTEHDFLDDGSGGYLVSESGMLLLAMQANTGAGKRARAEMIAVIKAWKRGRLLPIAETPTLEVLYGTAPFVPPDPSRGKPFRVVKKSAAE